MNQPKRALPVGPGHVFQSMSALSGSLGFAATKWVGVAPANASRGLPTVRATVLLNDVETGALLAILDGEALTVLRTAALSALAASHLARPDSRSVGFVGCGVQAAGHLDAFRDLLPGLADAVCFSGGSPSAARLAGLARAAGLAARVATSPGEALSCDIVVSSVRASADLHPFLDATLVRPGAFVAAVDLGISWRRETLTAFDLAATDDRETAAEPSTRDRLAFSGPFDADLAELVTAARPGRAAASQRALFLFAGTALADLAAAIVVYRAARDGGAGLALPA